VIREEDRTSGERVLTGVAVSKGIAIGRAHVLKSRDVSVAHRHLGPADVPGEVDRFLRAVDQSIQQLQHLREKLTEDHEDPLSILEAHQVMLRDELLTSGTIRRIEEERINAEWATLKTTDQILQVFSHIDDEYFRQRRSDVQFVSDRILRNLVGQGDLSVHAPPDAVVVARDFSPADVVQLQRCAVAGFVSEVGGLTSHSALVARAFELPMVVGIEQVWSQIDKDSFVVVDAHEGTVLVDPVPQTIAQYRSRARDLMVLERSLLQDRQLPAETTDGVRVILLANIELADEAQTALEHGAEGIGLYRTEYFYMSRSTFPTEEELIEDLQSVVLTMTNRPVTFRTFDLGGDKAAQLFRLHPSPNPALGLRSTRLALEHRDVFKTQLRAMIRSVNGGKLRLMFPMISDVSELRAARSILDEATIELEHEGFTMPSQIAVGIMIEMPSATILADDLAKECDFFSIGSNDLIQYALAIDRSNEHVAHLYRPLHPAIIRMTKNVVEAAHDGGLRVSVCGAMAGEPLYALVLLGIGVDELSMPPAALPPVRRAIRQISYEKAAAMADELVRLPTLLDIQQALARFVETEYEHESVTISEPGVRLPWKHRPVGRKSSN